MEEIMKPEHLGKRGAWLGCCALLLCLCAAGAIRGQDIVTKGAIGGRVADAPGEVVPTAKITVSGPTGERVVTATDAGEFEMPNLIPGTYSVKAEQTGFKSVSVPGVEVFVGRTSTIKLTLDAGHI